MKTCVGLFSFFWLLLGFAGAQERRGHERSWEHEGRPCVIFYEDADFQGGALVIAPGEAVDNLDHMRFDNGHRCNDRISSIRILGGAEVEVFTEAYFHGEGGWFRDDVRNFQHLPQPRGFTSWNDRISSFRVGLRHVERPHPRLDVDRVVREAYLRVLLREPDPEGARMYARMMVERDWNEEMLYATLRRSDEFRGPVVNRIIERAFLDILGHRPDPRAVEHYRMLILEKGLTDPALRDELMHSEEYRHNHRPGLPPGRPGERDNH
jgi:hypothetical protein